MARSVGDAWPAVPAKVIRSIFESKKSLAGAAAAEAARRIREAVAERSRARVVASTGISQYDFLAALVATPHIDWSAVELFHLDEYLGLPGDHPASFQRYVRERIIQPTGIRQAHLLDGMGDPEQVRTAAAAAISAMPVDVVFAGIGENGHLAFNDPPADFITDEPFLLVDLDERSRRQQVGEGWFGSLEEVPRRAITMSVRQILKARAILCIVTDKRKAEAVKRCFEGKISPTAPASALRLHPNVITFLDQDAASLLRD
jgi:glucosamine-6-phosphate deaminase